jgi:hypothetical protein
MYARTASHVVSSTTSCVRIGIGGVIITSESDYLERGQTTARDKCLFFSGLNCPGSEGIGRFQDAPAFVLTLREVRLSELDRQSEHRSETIYGLSAIHILLFVVHSQIARCRPSGEGMPDTPNAPCCSHNRFIRPSRFTFSRAAS